ncbi:Type I restriction-modification system M subunit [Actinobacillus pleuropneumoniae]|nr:Type I restriction-modification system M subunit [Actinobacillus pleuropneumoniae]
MSLNNLVKRLQDVMRNDAGINGDAQRIEQIVWILFFKNLRCQDRSGSKSTIITILFCPTFYVGKIGRKITKTVKQ